MTDKDYKQKFAAALVLSAAIFSDAILPPRDAFSVNQSREESHLVWRTIVEGFVHKLTKLITNIIAINWDNHKTIEI